MTSYTNWKCYASGKNPGGFGVFWFEKVDLANEEIAVCSGSDFDTPEIWDYLNDEGRTAGVMNMPSTYPSQPIEEFMISGGPDAVEGEYRSLPVLLTDEGLPAGSDVGVAIFEGLVGQQRDPVDRRPVAFDAQDIEQGGHDVDLADLRVDFGRLNTTESKYSKRLLSESDRRTGANWHEAIAVSRKRFQE